MLSVGLDLLQLDLALDFLDLVELLLSVSQSLVELVDEWVLGIGPLLEKLCIFLALLDLLLLCFAHI